MRTVGFFVGLCAGNKFEVRFDETSIDPIYYTLGVQLRNYFFLNEIEALLKLDDRLDLPISNNFFSFCIRQLRDNLVYANGNEAGYPVLYENGLIRMLDNNSFFKSNILRQKLKKTDEFRSLFEQIVIETDLDRKNGLISTFLLKKEKLEILLEFKKEEMIIEEAYVKNEKANNYTESTVKDKSMNVDYSEYEIENEKPFKLKAEKLATKDELMSYEDERFDNDENNENSAINSINQLAKRKLLSIRQAENNSQLSNKSDKAFLNKLNSQKQIDDIVFIGDKSSQDDIIVLF